MEQLSLFAPVGASEPSARVRVLASLLDKLNKELNKGLDEGPDEGLYLGTSSWSFPGWAGIVYDSKVSQTTLARHGLAAYARHPLFRTVCIDRTYYSPITAEDFARYESAVPEDFRFVVKAHELVTSARQKDDFASPNPLFLEPGYAVDEVIGPCLQGLGRKAAVMLLQFPPQMVDNVAAFNDKLHRFLSDLPKGVLYAVELRNHELFNEGYRELLQDVGASHCFNSHPKMLSLEDQVRQSAADAWPTIVVRWMLRRNLRYSDAKDVFYPFEKLANEDTGTRRTVASLCRDATRAFIIVNNKAEGSAPLSLISLAEEIVSPTR